MMVLYYLATFIPLALMAIAVKLHSTYFAWMYVLSIILLIIVGAGDAKLEAFSKRIRLWPVLNSILGWSAVGSVLIGWFTSWPPPSQTVSLSLIATLAVYKLFQGFVFLARAA